MAATVFDTVLRKLSEHAFSQFTLLHSLDDEVEFLKRTLSMIRCLLRDVDSRPSDQHSDALWEWVRQIQDLAYEMEDAVDEHLVRLDCWGRKGKLRRIATFPTQIQVRCELANRLQSINRRLQEMSNLASQLGIQGLSSSASSSSSTDTFLSRRYQLEDDVVGFDEDVKVIQGQLFDPQVTQRVVISIVGMGGLGKTTLANKIYKSHDVKEHFQCRAWVFVSQKCVVRELLASLVKQVTHLNKNEIKEMDELAMKNKLMEHLRGRRYLVVIDDIWEVAAWNAIKAAFPEGSTRSRVLLTTRKINVANIANTPPYQLRLLNSEESWNLFCQKAFPIASCPPHLQHFNEEIIRKSGGLPLAIMVLGGLLRGRNEINDWKRKLERISFNFREGEDQTQRILALSYLDLPHYLKPCFLYFAAFPEDYKISVARLIRLWTAEGLIQAEHGQTMEDLAETYLIELMDRSLIQLARKKRTGDLKKVYIHDLLLELARSKASDLNFYRCISNIGDDPTSPRRPRRLSVTENMDRYTRQSCSSPKIRSLLFCPKVDVYGSIELTSKYLRVLDLEDVSIQQLPEEIGDLILLRYINLRYSKVKELPSSIGNLRHLQSFDISHTQIRSIPDAFWNIQTLRHVAVHPENISMPKAECCLEDMQKLKTVRSGDWVRSGVLEKMRNLRNLELKEISSSDEEALANALKKLTRLVFLNLYGEAIPADILTSSQHHHLRLLHLEGPLVRHQPVHLDIHSSAFLPNLTVVILEGTMLDNDDICRLSTLPNLLFLRLLRQAFVGSVLVFPKGGFPRLQELTLFELDDLEEWRVGEGAMPCLQELMILNCNLRMLPEGLQRLPKFHYVSLPE